jgi:predicted transcriptional regulator of viral defense system
MNSINDKIITDSKVEKLINFLEKKLVINSKEAEKILGHKMAIIRLANRGVVEPVYDAKDLGFYTLPNTVPLESSFAILSRHYKDCVVSGPTCLSIYGLTDEYIQEIHVDIPNTNNLRNKLLKVHRVKKEKINNVVIRAFEDQSIITKIKIYSPERALHEAAKYYGKGENFLKAIRRYGKDYLNRKNPGEQYDAILKINKKVGMEIVNYLALGDLFEA